jgi:hypothetical protein
LSISMQGVEARRALPSRPMEAIGSKAGISFSISDLNSYLRELRGAYYPLGDDS